MISRRDALRLGAASLTLPAVSGVLPQPTMAAQEQGGNVPMFRGNAARTGEMPGPGPSLDKPIVVQLSVMNNWDQFPPAIIGGTMFLASGLLNMTNFTFPLMNALEVAEGKEVWQSPIEEAPSTAPTFADGVIYIGCQRPAFYAIDSNTGKGIWQFVTDGSIESSPAVAGGLVYFGSGDANLYALDAKTGEERWRFTASDAFTTSSPAIASEVIYIGSADANLYALDTTTGHELWRFTTGGEIASSPALADGVVFIGSKDSNIYAIDAASGTELWRAVTGGAVISSPATAEGIVYVGSSDNSLYALDASTGILDWQFVADAPIVSSPTICEGVVYAGSVDGRLYALEAASGRELWRYTADVHNAFPVGFSPIVVDGMVYVCKSVDYVSFLEVLSNTEDIILATEVVIHGAPSSTGVERGTAKAGDVISNVGAREEREGQMWAEVTVNNVTGWIPLDAIDPATLPPEGEIDYVYIPE